MEMESWKRTLYAAWSAQLIAILGFSFVLPFLPLYVQTLGVSDLRDVEVSAIALGFLGGKVGHRRVLTLSALAAGLTYIPQALVRGSLELLMLRGLMGLFIGGMLPSANALIGKLTPIHRRGSVYGVSSSAVAILSTDKSGFT